MFTLKISSHLKKNVVILVERFFYQHKQPLRNLISARLAADVMGVPTLLIARTDADAADLITSNIDPSRYSVYYR